MIDKCLEVLKNQLHQYLKSIPELAVQSTDSVAISAIAKADGSVDIPENQLGLSLVNIEEDRVHKSQSTMQHTASGTVLQMNPEIKLNLYVLVAANYKTYSTGLKFLSSAISFFQFKNVFTQSNTPELSPSIDKLVVELHTMGLEQQNHLWGYLGAKYLPSVCYRVRMIIVQEGLVTMQGSGVKQLDIQGRGL